MPVLDAVDVGSVAVKLGKLSGDRLEVAASVANPLGKVAWESGAEVTKVAEILKRAYGELKIQPKKVNVVIPESSVYSRVISLPVLSDAELASAIQWEAEQYVPIPLPEVELSWDVLHRPPKKTGDEKMAVLLVAAPKRVVNGLMAMLGELQIEPATIEPELVAVGRVLGENKELTAGTMVVVMGASGMGLGVFDQERLMFVSTLGSGGAALTRAITQGLQLPEAQAEEYKRTYGVMSGVLEGKLVAAMAPVLTGIVGEIRRAMAYFAEVVPGGKIGRLMLSGGVSLMPGLVQYLSSGVGAEVVVANPFKAIKAGAEVSSVASVYTPLVGSLLRR